jgi:hypothetical protein
MPVILATQEADQEDHSSKLAWENSSQDPILKKHHKKGLVRVAQGVSPEFNWESSGLEVISKKFLFKSQTQKLYQQGTCRWWGEGIQQQQETSLLIKGLISELPLSLACKAQRELILYHSYPQHSTSFSTIQSNASLKGFLVQNHRQQCPELRNIWGFRRETKDPLFWKG